MYFSFGSDQKETVEKLTDKTWCGPKKLYRDTLRTCNMQATSTKKQLDQAQLTLWVEGSCIQ